MRPEWRLTIAAAVALTAGTLCAEPYARLATPYYRAVDRLMARTHPWTIEEVAVAEDPNSRGSVLRLIGEVRRRRGDARPAATVVSRIQVGEVIETPLVFWTLLLAWPAAAPRERRTRVGVGAAAFLALEAMTTAMQLLSPMAKVSAILADDPLTLWERWTGFLESGGNFVLASAAALVTLAAANAIVRPRPPGIGGSAARG